MVAALIGDHEHDFAIDTGTFVNEGIGEFHAHGPFVAFTEGGQKVGGGMADLVAKGLHTQPASPSLAV